MGLFLAASVGAWACGGGESRRGPVATAKTSPLGASTAPSGRPRVERRPFVVIAIVVDQFAAWVADERLPLLPETGGFARLRREGAWARDVRFDHAATDTAPGHASLFTGAIPTNHGIFANEVLDPGTRKSITVLTDIEASTVSEKGAQQGGVSLKRLTAETVADRVREEVPDAWISSVSWKDRGALFGGGRHPDLLLYHDRGRNEFVTGPRSDMPFPKIALTLKDEISKIQSSSWTLLDAKWTRAHAPSPDGQKGEGDLEHIGTTFPHSFDRAQGLGVRVSPKADEALLDLTLRSLDEAKKAGKTHIFSSTSLSTNDYVGHVFGPSSWEAWDEILRLDAALGRFMTSLDERFGKAGYALVLSADHGVMRMPEVAVVKAPTPRDKHWELEPDRVPARVLRDALAVRLQKAIQKELGPGDYVLGIADPFVYLTDNTKKLTPDEWEKLWRTAAIELASTDGIERTLFLQEGGLGGLLADQTELRRLVSHSLAKGAGSIYLLTRRGSLIDTLYVPGKGTGHGSPYLYDRSVPILARATGRIREGAELAGTLSFSTYARTLAALAGVTPPSSAEPGSSLTELAGGGNP